MIYRIGQLVDTPNRCNTKYCVRIKGMDRCPFKGCSGNIGGGHRLVASPYIVCRYTCGLQQQKVFQVQDVVLVSTYPSTQVSPRIVIDGPAVSHSGEQPQRIVSK